MIRGISNQFVRALKAVRKTEKHTQDIHPPTRQETRTRGHGEDVPGNVFVIVEIDFGRVHKVHA